MTLWLLAAAGVMASAAGHTAITEGPPGSESGPYLRWELRSEPIPGRDGPEKWWFQDTVVLHAPDGMERWRRTLPERMRTWQVGIGNGEAEGHRRFPRTTHGLTFLFGLEWDKTAVAIADRTGMLVLARSDGRGLLDVPFGYDPNNRLWFDNGSFRLLGADGQAQCEGRSRGGRFFARCGAEWLYFNGSTLASIDAGTRVVRETARYDRAKHQAKGRRTTVHATIPLGKRIVEIDGIIYMRQ